MGDYLRLRDLSAGDQARILALETRGAMRLRLRELGFVEGAHLRCLGRSPMGDPAAYLVRGAVLALRDQDAAGILVERL